MGENRPEGDRMPEFGVNGAVLNTSAMTDDLRTKYLQAEPPQSAPPFRLATIIVFIAVVFTLGFALGLDQGDDNSFLQAENLYRAAFMLFCAALGYEGLTRRYRKHRRNNSSA